MAYAFGGRIDDDSYAVTYVDEDQGTVVTKGEINGVPFEGGGGGSDSPIYTANVKVNYTLPAGIDEITFYHYEQLTISAANNDPMAEFYYSDTQIPLTELGTPEMMKIPICDNGVTNILNMQFTSTGEDYLYMDSWSVVSGDAEVTEYTLNVFGDCEVNLTLVLGE